jgi:hypothetical protein
MAEILYMHNHWDIPFCFLCNDVILLQGLQYQKIIQFGAVGGEE